MAVWYLITEATLLSMVQLGSNKLKRVHIKASHMSTIWGLYFLRSKFPCLDLFRYLQAVVFVSNLGSFSLLFFLFLLCIWQYYDITSFFWGFWLYLLFASLPHLCALFCCSSALQCFHGVQIIMSANISQMINKNQFFHYDQNIVTSVNYWISVHPCWVFNVLLIAIFIILCCFSRNINFFLVVFQHFLLFMS